MSFELDVSKIMLVPIKDFKKYKKSNPELSTEEVRSRWLSREFQSACISLQKHLTEKPPANLLKSVQPDTCVQVKPENNEIGGVLGVLVTNNPTFEVSN